MGMCYRECIFGTYVRYWLSYLSRLPIRSGPIVRPSGLKYLSVGLSFQGFLERYYTYPASWLPVSMKLLPSVNISRSAFFSTSQLGHSLAQDQHSLTQVWLTRRPLFNYLNTVMFGSLWCSVAGYRAEVEP